ncbi:MAG TPA: hypothetical protein VK453_12115 [Micromonosporaceae bacterium]|nr:hypothetical protein [Micromonosporaceae bacterium]
MPATDPTARHQHPTRPPQLLKVTIYHNYEAGFMPYTDGQLLTAVTCHWLETTTNGDPLTVAEWAFRTFNADLDLLEQHRATAGGETTFLAAAVYRLLGHRSLSVGDVVEIQTGPHRQWLACDRVGWRPINAPSRLAGAPLTAATVYQHLTDRRTAR